MLPGAPCLPDVEPTALLDTLDGGRVVGRPSLDELLDALLDDLSLIGARPDLDVLLPLLELLLL